ncbi:CerR family C-terminal domain-containing protein [Desulforhopalus singaporensis]|uniref:Transcriptional regulator, TetR family n=1 Tax=Desulforhopalus singaporensis TaxID=91360 RepID=A0A1H0M4Y3_9BACT|nr:CerR family C-terminal domain-containing protein [Desulforhopalus singaporensis]SDO75351.1 transcriptional regulator, TetR family [Desulforhopalus singaporensis]
MTEKSRQQTKSTKQRLLRAAIDVFGRYGYEGATTRMIATGANVNIASIPYYYKGKEGLYRAAVSEVVTIVRSQIVQVQQEIATTDFSCDSGVGKARLLLERLLENVVMFMVGSPEAVRVSRIILREQLCPSAAYDLIFKGFMELMLDSLADLLVVLDPRQDRKTAKLRGVALMGQVIIFRVARETVVRALEFDGYDPGEIAEIRKIILEHTRSVVNALG